MHCMKKIAILFFVVLSGLLKAQQDPQFSLNMFNIYSVNPAFSGSYDQFNALAIQRSQWVGFDGAPNTQNLSYDTPLGYSGLGLGINLMNDEIGPSREIYLDANLSYTIETGEKVTWLLVYVWEVDC